MSFGSAILVYVIFNRLPRELDRGRSEKPYSSFVRRRLSFWPYALAGCLSWYGFQNAGLHPVLGLLPLIPAIPHADISFGLFSEAEHRLSHDLLTRMEHALRMPVEVVLMLFGLANAGVCRQRVRRCHLAGARRLMLGKPVGIWLFGIVAANSLKFRMPPGMNGKDLFLVGVVAGIGFTVSLFVATVAFPAGADQQAAKMGALLSFGMAGVAIILARMMRVRRQSFGDG